MKRGTKFFIAMAAAIITFTSLTVFAGPRYHIGWQYNGYYGGGYHRWYPNRNYWQPPYPPLPDSFYQKPPAPQKVY